MSLGRESDALEAVLLTGSFVLVLRAILSRLPSPLTSLEFDALPDGLTSFSVLFRAFSFSGNCICSLRSDQARF